MRKALLVVPIIMMMGCDGPALNLQKISIGMSEQQVIKIMGKPRTVAQQGKVKYLSYEETYYKGYVRLIDEKVESFGRQGDFDSAKDPTQKIIIDKTDKIAMDSVTKFDLATELAKLDKLKKDGLITAEDYEVLKKRAIEKAKE